MSQMFDSEQPHYYSAQAHNAEPVPDEQSLAETRAPQGCDLWKSAAFRISALAETEDLTTARQMITTILERSEGLPRAEQQSLEAYLIGHVELAQGEYGRALEFFSLAYSRFDYGAIADAKEKAYQIIGTLCGSALLLARAEDGEGLPAAAGAALGWYEDKATPGAAEKRALAVMWLALGFEAARAGNLVCGIPFIERGKSRLFPGGDAGIGLEPLPGEQVVLLAGESEVALHHGDLERAVTLLREELNFIASHSLDDSRDFLVISAEGYRRDARIRLAEILMRQGDIDGASQQVEEMWASGTAVPDHLLCQIIDHGSESAQQDFARGDFLKAAEKFRRLIPFHEAMLDVAGVVFTLVEAFECENKLLSQQAVTEDERAHRLRELTELNTRALAYISGEVQISDLLKARVLNQSGHLAKATEDWSKALFSFSNAALLIPEGTLPPAQQEFSLSNTYHSMLAALQLEDVTSIRSLLVSLVSMNRGESPLSERGDFIARLALVEGYTGVGQWSDAELHLTHLLHRLARPRGGLSVSGRLAILNLGSEFYLERSQALQNESDKNQALRLVERGISECGASPEGSEERFFLRKFLALKVRSLEALARYHEAAEANSVLDQLDESA